jgi:hypothetical protein
MVRKVKRALAILIMLAAAGQARAQDDMLLRAYAAVEPRLRAEFEFQMQGIEQQVLSAGAMFDKIAFFQDRLKMLSYNRAVLIAHCIADAQRDRPPTAAPVPMERNLVLTTCVDSKVGPLQKFSDRAAYADFFFPERIQTCGELARLPGQEQVLKPYAFLLLDEPRLYDFPRYNECLMKK